MSGNGVLLDSVILIDHLNGVSAATGYLRSIGHEAHISAITRAEVLTGLAGLGRQAGVRLLDCFTFHGIEKEAADLAAELRREHGWRLPDAFQAAVALRHELSLATRNTKDFSPERYSFVVVPYVLAPGGGVADKVRRKQR